MELKEAVRTAKTYILDLYAEEQISEVGLEEIEFDEGRGRWNITIGFRRPGVTTTANGDFLAILRQQEKRSYKVVQLRDADGALLSVKDRLLRDAA